MSPIMTGRSFRRHVEILDLDLTTLKRAAKAWGGTLNDVFVASVVRGLTLYHEQHGVAATGFRVLMPVNVRDTADHEGGNHFVPARFVIPVHSDIADGVAEVRRNAEQWKHAPGLAMSDVLATGLSALPAGRGPQPLEFDAHGRRPLHHEHPGTSIAGLSGRGRRRRHLCRHTAIGGRTQRVTGLHGGTGLCHHHNRHRGGCRQPEARRLHRGRILGGLLRAPTRPSTVDMTVSVDLLTELDASFLLHGVPADTHAHGLDRDLRGRPIARRPRMPPARRSAGRRCRAGCIWCRSCARSSDSRCSASQHRCGWTTPTSISPATCARLPCPSPATKPSCWNSVPDLMSSRLDRDRPLWSIWLIDGLEDGRVAVLEMIHHCMADGLAGVELASVLLDLEASPSGHHHVGRMGTRSRTRVGPPWSLTDSPDSAGSCRRSRQTHGMPSWHPSQARRVLSRYASAFFDLLSQTPVAPHVSLNASGRIRSHRCSSSVNEWTTSVAPSVSSASHSTTCC